MARLSERLASIDWRDRAALRTAYRYWVRDTAIGVWNLGLYYLLRCLPTGLCSGIGARLALAYAPRRYRRADARARLTFAHLRPEAGPAEIDAAIRTMWDGIGRTFSEFATFDRLWAEGRIAVVGAAHLTAARAHGRPVVVVGLHLANWETIGLALRGLGYRFSDIYEPPANRFDHWVALRARRLSGVRLLPPGRAATRPAMRTLTAERGILLIYIDELAGGRVHAPTFGRALEVRGNIANAVRFARMSGASLIPAYAERLSGAHFRVTFMPPLALANGEDREAILRENVCRLDAAIEPIVRRGLAQWYMLPAFRLDR